MNKKLFFCLTATALLQLTNISQAQKCRLHSIHKHFNGEYFSDKDIATDGGNVSKKGTLGVVALTTTKIKNYQKIINSA
jgi:hypothetical protein